MGEPFRYLHRVSYAECTVGNHIYYSRYLDLFEAARGGFFRAIGHPISSLQLAGYIFPVMECDVRYRHAARYDDEVVVAVRLIELTKVRLVFQHSMSHSNHELLAEGRITHAVTGLNEKPKRLTQELFQAFRTRLEQASDRDNVSLGRSVE